jgi:hypothetical protein
MFASVSQSFIRPATGLLITSTETSGTAFFTFLARIRKTILRKL